VIWIDDEEQIMTQEELDNISEDESWDIKRIEEIEE